MVNPFGSRHDVDRWYSQSTFGLARALKAELRFAGVEHFNASKRFTCYEEVLQGLNNIKVELYQHLRARRRPRILAADDLVRTLNYERSVISKVLVKRQ